MDPTTSVAEQGFNQVLHMCNAYRNCLGMNKTGGIDIRLKLTILQPGLKKLTDEKPGKKLAVVGINCVLEMNIIFYTTSTAFVWFVRSFRAN